MTTTEIGRHAAPARVDRARWRLAELVGLCGLTIAQPILDVYARNPLELISRQVEGLAVVVFAVVVVLVPAVVLFAVEQVVGLVSPRWATRVHQVFLAVLAGCFVALIFPAGPAMGYLALVAAVAVAIGFWFAVRRLQPMQQWLRLLAISPVIFAVFFLVSDSIGDLAFGSTPAAASLPDDGSLPSIVVVVLDELPTSSLLGEDGAIDPQRYPNLAALAEGGTWYRNNVTLGSWTSVAVPGIVTGQHPEPVNNRAHWSTYPENLFTLLGGRYRVVAHESSTRLCPDAICPGTGRPDAEALGDLIGSASSLWRELVDPFEDLEVAFEPAGGNQMTKSQARQIAVDTAEEVAASTEPTLAYLHLSLPHQPWHFVASGQSTNAPDIAPGMVELRWGDAMAAASAYQSHLLQAQFADTVLGDLIDGLKEANRYDDTLVVVAADHGVSFRAGQFARAMSEETLPDVAFTPLFVKVPGQEAGGTDDRPVQTVDIISTIADVIGIDIPWDVDGVALSTGDRLAERERRYFPMWLDQLEAGPGGYAVLPDTPLLDLIRSSGRPVGSAAALDSLGTEPGLAGRSVRDVGEAPGSDDRVVVHGGADLLDLDTAAPTLPLFVDLEFAQDEPGDIAVAVNGTIAVTGRVGGPDRRHLWAVIPPSRVTTGSNEVLVYRVSGTSARPELTPLATVVD